MSFIGFNPSNPLGFLAPTTNMSNAGMAQAISGIGQSNQAPSLAPTAGANGASQVAVDPSNPAATGIGWNLGTLQMGLGGLQALGNIWSAWQANQLAQKQFAFQKDVTNTNLANQIQSYNTTLEDRVRSRAQVEQGQANGLQPGAQAQSYLDSHKLASRTIG